MDWFDIESTPRAFRLPKAGTERGCRVRE
jgi:hypothetical protein